MRHLVKPVWVRSQLMVWGFCLILCDMQTSLFSPISISCNLVKRGLSHGWRFLTLWNWFFCLQRISRSHLNTRDFKCVFLIVCCHYNSLFNAVALTTLNFPLCVLGAREEEEGRRCLQVCYEWTQEEVTLRRPRLRGKIKLQYKWIRNYCKTFFCTFFHASEHVHCQAKFLPQCKKAWVKASLRSS